MLSPPPLSTWGLQAAFSCRDGVLVLGGRLRVVGGGGDEVVRRVGGVDERYHRKRVF
jgi:hypothetical protein